MACNVTRGFCLSAFVLELCMAGSPWQQSWTSLTIKAPIVDYLGTCRFHLNFRTALGVRRHLKKKPIKAKSNGYLLDSVFTVTPTWHTLWLAHCCLLVSSAISIASRLALAAKLLLQTITKELTLQCATRRGFCEICSFIHSFVRSVHRAAETIAHFWNSVKVWTDLARQWVAIWLVDFAEVVSFSSYVWLAHLNGRLWPLWRQKRP